ncbi:hypothetical protein GQ53DRAFT_828388 [Thozetella sp. PMI_491]|nr:hypothetical protein GQ53DRAFT_828388 [Thozetella sp. PMI_491]
MAGNTELAANVNPSPTLDELIQRNKEYAATHIPMPYVTELAAEAYLLRNMAGHIQSNLGDLAALDAVFHFRQVIIVHHTDCGATHMSAPKIRGLLKSMLPGDTDSAIDSMIIPDYETGIEQSIRDDLKILKESPLIRESLKNAAVGLRYDIKSGLVSQIS